MGRCDQPGDFIPWRPAMPACMTGRCPGRRLGRQAQIARVEVAMIFRLFHPPLQLFPALPRRPKPVHWYVGNSASVLLPGPHGTLPIEYQKRRQKWHRPGQKFAKIAERLLRSHTHIWAKEKSFPHIHGKNDPVWPYLTSRLNFFWERIEKNEWTWLLLDGGVESKWHFDLLCAFPRWSAS